MNPNDQSESSAVTVALVQSRCGPSVEENIEKAVRRIADATDAGAQIVCLQELFATEYPCQSEDHTRFALAESIPGPTTERLSALAKSNQLVIIAPMFERRAPGIYHNTAVVIDADGSIVGTYRKMHIPDDPLYYEKFYFTPGDLGFQSFATRYGRVGVCICWDQWFPEAARLTALTGAQIIFFPTAIGWTAEDKAECGADQFAAWRTMMQSHAIANGLFVAAPNRTGTEGELEFWGGSFVADPCGVVLGQAAYDTEETLLVECELGQIDQVRTHWPFLRDRRIDVYGDLTRRYLT